MPVALSSTERRVLGCLLEKERTVPDTYPMTLKGVVTACNQSSGRDPVMSLAEHEITSALDSLRQLELTRRVLPSHGARTEKYRQVADEVWHLEDPERAIVTLLLLRGPQTPGELRSRSGRLHQFDDLDEVDAALRALAGRDDPLVEQLGREAGRKERRWRHLFASDEELSASLAALGADGASGRGIAGEPDGRRVAEAVPLHPDVQSLAVLVGTWTGDGHGTYPTIEPFDYHETITFTAVPRKPMLAYRSTTTAADDGRPLHGEVGWLRVVGDGLVELVIAQAPGLLEAAEGIAETGDQGCALMLASTVTASTTTAKELSTTEREYRVDGDQLTYRISMSAVGQGLGQHLVAVLHRGMARAN